MEKLYKIKEALTQALEESKTAKTGDLQAGEIDAIHKLTDTIKNIDKICMLEEEGGYSQDGGQGGNSYGRGSSYANRGQHYVRGHYSREGGSYDGGSYDSGNGGYSSRRGGSRSGRGSSRSGGYSRDDGRSEMMEHLEMALDSANEQDREDIKRFMRQLENN